MSRRLRRSAAVARPAVVVRPGDGSRNNTRAPTDRPSRDASPGPPVRVARCAKKAVLRRKSSMGSASRSGSLFVERMLTVCESLRAQGRSILDFLVGAFRAHGERRASPSLMPAA